MQVIGFEILGIIAFAVGVGTLSSMIGIGGGILNTPLLIIVFGLSAQQGPATALVAALFVALASSASYWRQKPRPILPRVGLLLAVTTAPGSIIGVMMRTLISDDMILRIIFGVSLMPVALKMLFAKKKEKGDLASELASFDEGAIVTKTWAMALFGAFIGGISAGLLGIGGGAIVVPVLSMILGLPMHAAVATSMFTMMFTATSGTALNYLQGYIDPFFALSLGVGMLVGGQIGSRFACRVNAVQLKRIFGVILVFPLVKMMRLGQLWLGSDAVASLVGDVLIWALIVGPIGLLRLYQLKKGEPEMREEGSCSTV
jgi:uncharacterized membrane protein YfcA